MFRTTPLSTGFFLVSIIGFFVGTYIIYPISKTWGFTFALFFIIMFIASFVSMTYSSVDDMLRKESEKVPKPPKRKVIL